jgi:UDP-galactopyranose mutase
MMNDFLIVGTGLFGATFARLATDAGYKCLVIDKRKHIGGNCYTEKREGIDLHFYGPHIFHTSNEAVWGFVNRFASFNSFINAPKAFFENRLYSLPFSMNTFHELWGVVSPKEAKQIIEAERWKGVPSNLEEQALSMVGATIYNTLIKGYTEKQWGRKASELPASIIKRLPLRFTFDSNYFNDKYQGIPLDGYTTMFEKMLDGIETVLGIDFLAAPSFWKDQAKHVIYTGCIDQYFNYEFGSLNYRTLDFAHNVIACDNYQGNAVINYSCPSVPYTRKVEHKHFSGTQSDLTIITTETPRECESNDTPYYPIATEDNLTTFRKYKMLTDGEANVLFGGRLAEYKYMDMHVVIESAMNKWKTWQKANATMEQ